MQLLCGSADCPHAIALWVWVCRLSSCSCSVGVGVQTVFMPSSWWVGGKEGPS